MYCLQYTALQQILLLILLWSLKFNINFIIKLKFNMYFYNFDNEYNLRIYE